MGDVTINQMLEWAAWLLSAAGTLGALYVFCAKIFKTVLAAALKPIDDKLDKMATDIKRVELERCKDFLTRFLADVEQGQPIDEVELERFHEVYARYTSPELGGNSYIHSKVEKLRNAGKL